MKRILPLIVVLTFIVLGAFTQGTRAAKWTADMKEGKVAFQSMGPLAFGPDGILLAADTKAAAIVAIATGDTAAASLPRRSRSKASIRKSRRCLARAPIRF